MLDIPAEFPHVGSIGYLRGTALPARILRHNAARPGEPGTSLVELLERTALGPRRMRVRTASGNRTVETGDLYPTTEDAMFCGRPPRRERRRGGRRRKAGVLR